MKLRHLKYLAYVLIFTVITYGGASLIYFNVSSNDDKVVLEWQTQDEDNIQKFEIFRKSQNSNFLKIDEVKATGSYSVYKYVDKNIYKSATNNFTYKLKFINTQGKADGYSSEKSVMPNISSVKRTWGSIKALFR